MLRDKIKSMGQIAHGDDSYDDSNERNALRTFLAESPQFQKFWADYFGIIPNSRIEDDPLGSCKVDLGLMDATYYKIHGLIEVDVFNSWEFGFPSNYKYFHVLERKLKYFLPSDYHSEDLKNHRKGIPYITCSFNRYHDQMVSTTRENIVDCLEKYGVTEMWMPKIQEYDRVVRCPLDDNIKWFSLISKELEKAA